MHACMRMQVMGKSLVYEGAPLRLERKVDFVNRKQEERSARGATGEAHSLVCTFLTVTIVPWLV